MISAIVGVPGCGKTCRAVELALEYIASGGCVFTNIRFTGVEINPVATGLVDKYRLAAGAMPRKVLKHHYSWEYCEGQYNFIDLDTMDKTFLPCIPHGSAEKPFLLLLDEVNEWFDTQDRGKQGRDDRYDEMFSFLRLSRHYHVDVMFMLQDFQTLNNRLRNLCQYVYRPFNLAKVKIPLTPFNLGLPMFVLVTMNSKGMILEKTTSTHKQFVWDCYDSHCEFRQLGLASGSFQANYAKKGKGGKKMTGFDRTILVIAFASLFYICKQKNVQAGAASVKVVCVTNTVSRVESPVIASGGTSAPSGGSGGRKITVEYSPLSYGCAQSDVWAYAAGRLFRVGMEVPQGRVVSIEPWGIRIVSDGWEHWIYKSEDTGIENAVKNPSIANVVNK